MEFKKIEPKKGIAFLDSSKTISNIYDLERIGAGHDGIVFRDGDKVLKLLKYDISLRKDKKLMTFEKARAFKEELNLHRIVQPTDVFFDFDGVFSGYEMNYLDDVTLEKKKGTPLYKQPGDFTCGELVNATSELEEDFNQLTIHRTVAKDINRGSYIYTTDFLHLCDMDKFLHNTSNAEDFNKKALNFAIAKFLYYEMLKTDDLDKMELKQLSYWVKKSSNSRSFVKELKQDIGSCFSYPISEYAQQKVKTIIR